MKKALKRGLSLLLAITIIFGSMYAGLSEVDFGGLFAVKAQAASESDLTFKLSSDGTYYSVSKCATTATGELIIPSVYNELPVTTIVASAFQNCKTLTSVVIPDSITTIGASAFYGCAAITSITIPDSVTSIGSKAFYNCSAITSVSIGSGLTTVGTYAFYGCKSLADVYVTNLAGWCGIDFDYSSQATPLYYAQNLYVDGELVTELTIPDTVTKIGAATFAPYAKLTSVTIPNSVTSIGNYAFYQCTGLTSVTIPNSVTSIGNYAFYQCTGLTSVTIPDSVITIGNYTFSQCSGLTAINIPNSVTSIGTYAFAYNSNVTEVTLGTGLKTVANSAFYSCKSLEAVNISDLSFWCEIDFSNSSANPLYTAQKLYLNGTLLTGELIAPEGTTKIGTYTFFGYKNVTSVTVPNTVKTIGQYAFGENTSLKTLILADGLEKIDAYAFYSCSELTSITLPDSVTTIGNYAFYSCTGLTSVDIPVGVKTLGADVFYKCSNLTTISIPSSITSIGGDAFGFCDKLSDVYISDLSAWCIISFSGYASNPFNFANNLYVNNILVTELVIPEGVTTISKYAFYNLDNITSVTIPNSVTTINSYAFTGCDKLETAVVGDGVKTIGENVFSDCSSLKTLTIGKGVTSVNRNALLNCSNFETYVVSDESTSLSSDDGVLFNKDKTKLILFPMGKQADVYTVSNTVTTIATYAFNNCTSVNAVVLPDTVTAMESYAFNNCTGLEKIVLGNGLTSIPTYAFYGCKNLYSVTLPDSLLSLGNYAFYGCGKIRSISLPSTVETLGTYVFYNCSELGSITIPDSVTSVGNYAFAGCTSLMKITLPDSITTLGTYVFSGCSSLISANIPNTVQTIGSRIFNNCKALVSVVIPFSVTTVGTYAFYGCSALKYVFYEGAENDWAGVTINSNNNPLKNAAVHYEAASHTIVNGNCTYCDFTEIGFVVNDGKAYISSYSGSAEDIVIPSEHNGYPVAGILINSFYGCDNLVSITLPSSLEFIEESAFKGCTSLSAVYVEDVSSWLNISFENATSNPLYYGANLYINNELASSVVVPNGVTNINPFAFVNYTGMSLIVLPNSVSNIGNDAFEGCDGLEYVVYNGAQAEYSDIDIGEFNASLTQATLHTNEHQTKVDKVINLGDCEHGGSVALICEDCGCRYIQTSGAVGHYYVDDICKKCGEALSELDYIGEATTVIVKEGVLESAHSYSNNANDIKTFVADGADYITVAFSSDTKVEYDYDEIRILDANGVTIASYTGTNLAGKTITVTGDTLKIQLKSDGSNVYYGYYANCVAYESTNCSGHVHKKFVNVLEADCYNNGYTGDLLCAMCDFVITKGETLPRNHSYIDNECSICSSRYFDYTIENGEAIITGYLANDSDIVIPAFLGGYPVTTIGSEAFADNTRIESVTIQDNVTNIYSSSFSGCSNLSEINLPNSLKNLGSHCFDNTAYANDTNNWSDGVLYIGNYLVSVVAGDYDEFIIKDGTILCANVFTDSIVVSTLHIPASLIYLNNNLIVVSEKVVVDEENPNYTAVDGVLFNKEKTSLFIYPRLKKTTNYQIPNTVEVIGSYAFYEAKNVRNVIIPESVTRVEDFAFCNASVNSLILPDSLKYIGDFSMYSQSLNVVSVGENVEYIGFLAIGGVATTIILPATVTGLQVNAVVSEGFGTVYFGGTEAELENYINNGQIAGDFANIYANKTVSVKNSGDFIYLDLPNNQAMLLAYIGEDEEVVLPSNLDNKTVTDIGKAFFNFTLDDEGEFITNNIKSVTVPETVTSIGSMAFWGCISLERVSLPNTLVNIREYAFAYCSSLEKINFPDSLRHIGGYAFMETSFYNQFIESMSDCLYIDSALICVNPGSTYGGVLEVENGTKIIADYALEGCDDVTDIILPDSIISIGENAFVDTSAYQKNSNWVDGALYFGDYLIKVDLPQENNGDVTIKPNTKLVANGAFSSNTDVNKVIIPNTLTDINKNAFADCVNLEYVVFDGSAEEWNNITFDEGNEVLSLAVLHTNDHAIESNVTINAQTCEQNGACEIVCADCGVEYTKTTEALGHYFVCGVCEKCSLTLSEFEEQNPLTLLDTAVLESPHNYPNNSNDEKSFTCVGADFIKVTFSDDFNFEDGFDYIEVYGKNNIYIGSFSTNELAGETINVDGDTVKIVLISDYSQSYYGYYATCEAYGWGSNGCQNHLHKKLVNTLITDCEQKGYSGDVLCAICDYIISYGEEVGYTHKYVDNVCSTCHERCFDYYIENDCIIIDNYVGTASNVVVPATIDGYPITEIDDFAFCDNQYIKSISISDSVTKIGEYAFSGCNNLESVDFGNNVTSIYDYAFNLCRNITDIYIPDSVSYISGTAFVRCYGVNEFVVSKNNMNYSSRDGVLFNKNQTVLVAFPLGANISYYAVPNGVESIGEQAFFNASIKKIRFQNTLKHIGEAAFQNCHGLSEIELPESIETIGRRAFSYSQLTSISLPEKAINIGDAAFENTSYYNYKKNWENDSLYIGKHLIEVDENATGTYEVKDGTLSVAGGAFYDCSYVENVAIPSSVAAIGTNNYISKILCFEDSYAHTYAIENSLSYAFIALELFESVSGDVPEIDYENMIIYTTLEEITSIKEILNCPASEALTSVASNQLGYRSFYGTGSNVSVCYIGDFTLVVKGDVDGDSVCDALDAMHVGLVSNGLDTLDGAYALAADSNADDIVDANDYQAIVNKAIS